MSIAEYIHQLQSIEEYAFSWKELLENCDKTKTSLKSELSRLVAKNKIINLRKEFYLIIPARYAKQGKIPIQLYIQKLFKALNRNYYLGFYSAAKFHGASHQQVHREYVITENPKLVDINKNEILHRFFTATNWPYKNIQEKKSDAGIYKISSPVLTAVDLIHYQTKLGGINRMLAILEELIEAITINDVSDLLSWYSHRSTLQRLGYLLDILHADSGITNLINEYLESSKYFPVLLTPKSNQKPGSIDNKWKVDVNIKLENDL